MWTVAGEKTGLKRGSWGAPNSRAGRRGDSGDEGAVLARAQGARAAGAEALRVHASARVARNAGGSCARNPRRPRRRGARRVHGCWPYGAVIVEPRAFRPAASGWTLATSENGGPLSPPARPQGWAGAWSTSPHTTGLNPALHPSTLTSLVTCQSPSILRELGASQPFFCVPRAGHRT